MSVALICLFIFMVVVAILASRAGYKLGVLDGFKAGQSPNDPLYETNGVRKILRDYGENP